VASVRSQGSGDIFDRSFKQIIGSLSDKALVCFINSLFGVNHPIDSPVIHLNTEQIDKNLKKQQPDIVVSIGGKIYVIEEQTGPDKNMAIRVFEYGYAQALKDKEIKDGVIALPFPRMIVIYLEAGTITPDVLKIRLEFPDGTEHDFKVKTLKPLDYGVEELAEKGFAPLLPFYIETRGNTQNGGLNAPGPLGVLLYQAPFLIIGKEGDNRVEPAFQRAGRAGIPAHQNFKTCTENSITVKIHIHTFWGSGGIKSPGTIGPLAGALRGQGRYRGQSETR
jgi:hypothetical protein